MWIKSSMMCNNSSSRLCWTVFFVAGVWRHHISSTHFWHSMNEMNADWYHHLSPPLSLSLSPLFFFLFSSLFFFVHTVASSKCHAIIIIIALYLKRYNYALQYSECSKKRKKGEKKKKGKLYYYYNRMIEESKSDRLGTPPPPH